MSLSRRQAVAASAVLVVACLAAAGAMRWTSAARIAPGAELFSVVAHDVMALTYTTSTMEVAARRARPGAAFDVRVTYADGRVAQSCTSAPDLAGTLGSFAALVVRRPLGADDAGFPVPLGTVQIRDRIEVEPIPAMRYRAAANRAAVAVYYADVAAEVETSVTVFATLEAGCQRLAVR